MAIRRRPREPSSISMPGTQASGFVDVGAGRKPYNSTEGPAPGYVSTEGPAATTAQKAQMDADRGLSGLYGGQLPPTPDFAVPDWGAFQGILGQQRDALAQSYQQALAEIARQEGVSLGTLKNYAPQQKQIYGDAKSGLQQFAQMSKANQAGSGLTSYAPQYSGLEPFLASNKAMQANALSLGPMLRTGVQDLYQRQRGQAQAIQQEGMQGLLSHELDLRGQVEMARVDAENKAKELGYSSALDMYKAQQDAKLAQWSAQQGFNTDVQKAVIGAQIKAGTYPGMNAGSQYAVSDISPQRGSSFTPEERTQIRSFRSYSAIRKDIFDAQQVTVDDGKGKQVRKYSDEQIVQLIHKKWSSQPRAASLALAEFAGLV